VYTVSQAAALTGIPATTLRAWERRYGLITPTRTRGGYRLYDAAQIEKLREMTARVAGGMRAAQAAASLHDYRTSGPGPGRLGGSGDLVAAAESLDPTLLRPTIDAAFASADFEHVVGSWLLPQLERLGEAWACGRLSVAQEHFASAELMAALSSFFHASSEGARGATVLVGLPAGARHELVLFAFATCLRRLGSNVVYLGADLPAADWQAAARGQHPRAAVLGAHSLADADAASGVVDALNRLSPAVSVWVGGSCRAAVHGAAPLPDDVSEAARRLNRILMGARV
jgi:DNA-binding transcriptional MerR regulator